MEEEEPRINVYSSQKMSLEKNGLFGTNTQQSVNYL